MSVLEKQFNQHFEVISSRRFREGSGLGNEVPFFISTFPAEKQNEASMLIDKLEKRLNLEGIPVMTINLFQLCVKLLEDDGVLDEIRREYESGRLLAGEVKQLCIDSASEWLNELKVKRGQWEDRINDFLAPDAL